jgi:hypothetical protein
MLTKIARWLKPTAETVAAAAAPQDLNFLLQLRAARRR